jgi:hypothetical protein
MPSDAPSVFIKYIGITEYTGEKNSASSKVPIHAFTRVLSLAMQALLVALKPLTDRVILKLQAFS